MKNTQRRAISLLVDNNSGVLARISSLFCRKGFNIHSISSSTTNDPLYSRITVTVDGEETDVSQLLAQTNRLEDTIKVFELDPSNSLQRELLLIKVFADKTNRIELHEIANIYKAKILDLSPASMVFELTGSPEKIDAFVGMFANYEILEMCRTGVTAMDRGGMHFRPEKPEQDAVE